jgi:hypothetical protein
MAKHKYDSWWSRFKNQREYRKLRRVFLRQARKEYYASEEYKNSVVKLRDIYKLIKGFRDRGKH